MIKEICTWQAMGTPDDSELYADTATIRQHILAQLDEPTPISEFCRTRADSYITTALTDLCDAGLIKLERYGDHRPFEWELTPFGRDTLTIATERTSAVNERAC